MNYALERLTAPKPDWDFAFVFVKGMDDPLGVKPGVTETRWLREHDLIEIYIPRIIDPTNPPSEGGMGPDGPVPASPGGLAKLTAYVHVDEINAINFYNSYTEEDYKKIGAKATSKADYIAKKQTEGESTILTADGEDPKIAAEREQLTTEREKGNKKEKSSMKKV